MHTLGFVCHTLLLCRCCMLVPANASRRCSGPFAMPLEHATCNMQPRVASSSCPSDTSGACNDNCFESRCDLKLLAGLQYTNFNVSGADMETSMSDLNTWTQQVMLKDIVNRPTGAQQGQTNCREFVSKSVGDTHPKCVFKVAESKCYPNPRQRAESQKGRNLA